VSPQRTHPTQPTQPDPTRTRTPHPPTPQGLLAWPFIDLPFTSFGKALAAQKELLAFFQEAVDETRAQVAAGREVPGILGSLVTAVDEDGNM
jgi:hypothetical protein